MSGEENCAEWEQSAADADKEATKFQPAEAALAQIRQALDRARQRLGGQDVGKHRVCFHRHRWQFGDVVLPAASSLGSEYVSRQDGFTVGQQQPTESANWLLFCTSFVFGYGRSGFGSFRFRRIMRRTTQPGLWAVIAEARRLLAQCGPLSAYDYLRGGNARRVPYWGPAFFTKLLYFADSSRSALILDNQLAWIVHKLSGMPHLVNRYGGSECWTTWRYGVYLAWMRQVADRLEVQPDFLEYALFLEAKRRRR